MNSCDQRSIIVVNKYYLFIFQAMLSSDSAVLAETGDSWFNCQKLKLPDGCG